MIPWIQFQGLKIWWIYFKFCWNFLFLINIWWNYGIMSLLRHSILRHLLLRQSLLRLLILRQWQIVFAILALLAIQMQYGTAHLSWKGHGFYLGVVSFFRMPCYCVWSFSARPNKIFFTKENIISCRSNKNAFSN
jgi:hypothetical protein